MVYPSHPKTSQRRLNTLRIISGSHRTRKIQFPDAPGLRPTPDRVRETLFNWLRDSIHGAHCLDLFAGSGALGLEALSRGAAQVDFVENNAQVRTALANSVTALNLENADIHGEDALQWVLKQNVKAKQFDIVFLDPPFADKLLPQACALLEQSQLLAPNAKIYIETDAEDAPFELPAGWQLLKSKRAGNVNFSLYSRAGTAKQLE